MRRIEYKCSINKVEIVDLFFRGDFIDATMRNNGALPKY
jgi:hypothetical protein